jgi:hypothetical protein
MTGLAYRPDIIIFVPAFFATILSDTPPTAMPLKVTIDHDIKDAMRAKDQGALRALRAIKAAILVEETAEGRTDPALSAADEIRILQKQVKQRRDAMEQFQQNGRQDLADKESEELAVIERYLPKQLEGPELEARIKAVIEETGATSLKDLGKVMGAASKALAGQADNKVVSEMVKKLLS